MEGWETHENNIRLTEKKSGCWVESHNVENTWTTSLKFSHRFRLVVRMPSGQIISKWKKEKTEIWQRKVSCSKIFHIAQFYAPKVKRPLFCSMHILFISVSEFKPARRPRNCGYRLSVWVVWNRVFSNHFYNSIPSRCKQAVVSNLIRSKHRWKLARLSSVVNWRTLASFSKGNVVSTFISISTLVQNAGGPIWLYLDSCL